MVEKGPAGAPGPAPRAGRGARLGATIPLWTVPRGRERLHLPISGHHPGLEIKKDGKQRPRGLCSLSPAGVCPAPEHVQAEAGASARAPRTRPNLSGARAVFRMNRAQATVMVTKHPWVAGTRYALLARKAGDIRVPGRDSWGPPTTVSATLPAGRTGIPVKGSPSSHLTQKRAGRTIPAHCPRFGVGVIKRPKGPSTTSAGLVPGPR